MILKLSTVELFLSHAALYPLREFHRFADALTKLLDPYLPGFPGITLSKFDSAYLVPTTPVCTWWNRPEEDISSGKLESTHPSRTVVKSIGIFMMSSQLYAATLTHYSTEPLTTGPDYDPLLLLLALAVDVHPNPGPSRYPCSVCFKNVTSQGTSYMCTICSHWVHSRCTGLRNAADYRGTNGWICTACITPPQPRAPSPPLSPAHTPTMSDKTVNILQWNANSVGNKQTELSIFLEAHNVKVAAIQESKLTA